MIVAAAAAVLLVAAAGAAFLARDPEPQVVSPLDPTNWILVEAPGGALLVSQDFHIRRATALCRAAGIDSYGVAVPEPRDATWYAGGLREIPGAAKAAFDVGVTPDPHFLGPHERGVDQALADARRGAGR